MMDIESVPGSLPLCQKYCYSSIQEARLEILHCEDGYGWVTPELFPPERGDVGGDTA
jgi:hypothetical protein